jgi:DNA-directed RNA polymerase
VSLEPSELLINAAVAEGITSIAIEHDRFGCLPSRAERFGRIVGEQFVRLYKDHDVLQAVLEQARTDLKDPEGLPAAPPSTPLDIEQVLDAESSLQ